jgi:hypothetical protein
MQLKIEECKGCSKDKPIVNRKHGLCNECNTARLHPENDSFTNQRQLQRTQLMKSVKKPKQISEKQKMLNLQIKETYQQMARTRIHACTGCGTTQRLSHSHLIPRSRRKDLEADIDNLTYHCLSIGEIKGCHDVWEHGTLDEKMLLHDFESNMLYIKRIDFEYYSLITR